MSEQIEKLAKKSGLLGRRFMYGKYYDDELTDEQKKFAMLIIQECIRVPYAMWDKAELNADIAVKIDHKIKDHFGVEE